jgi:integrase
MLTGQLGFGPEDPLFPATLIGRGEDRAFRPVGLSRKHWRTAAPIRQIFRAAFEAAGLPYAKPHSFRDTLAQLGERLCRTPEEWKAWSQNLGHESEATTFVGYGHVPTHRQTEIMRGFAHSPEKADDADADVEALDALVQRMKRKRSVAA